MDTINTMNVPVPTTINTTTEEKSSLWSRVKKATCAMPAQVKVVACATPKKCTYGVGYAAGSVTYACASFSEGFADGFEAALVRSNKKA